MPDFFSRIRAGRQVRGRLVQNLHLANQLVQQGTQKWGGARGAQAMPAISEAAMKAEQASDSIPGAKVRVGPTGSPQPTSVGLVDSSGQPVLGAKGNTARVSLEGREPTPENLAALAHRTFAERPSSMRLSSTDQRRKARIDAAVRTTPEGKAMFGDTDRRREALTEATKAAVEGGVRKGTVKRINRNYEKGKFPKPKAKKTSTKTTATTTGNNEIGSGKRFPGQAKPKGRQGTTPAKKSDISR